MVVLNVRLQEPAVVGVMIAIKGYDYLPEFLYLFFVSTEMFIKCCDLLK
jgi:hypothetical protein